MKHSTQYLYNYIHRNSFRHCVIYLGLLNGAPPQFSPSQLHVWGSEAPIPTTSRQQSRKSTD